MKKKILILCAAMLMMFGFGICVNAYDGTAYDDFLYYQINDYNTAVTITDCDSSATEIIIPSEIKGLPVTSIRSNAFYDCNSLTSVTIPDSVTSIGNYAFWECSSLDKVYISDIAAWCGIEFVGWYANPLYHAENLYLNDKLVTSLIIPNDVTSIKNYTFVGCKCITSVVIPDSVTSIGEDAFYGCDSLTSVTIGKGVASIGEGAFYCDNLESVYISDIDAWCNIKFDSSPLQYADKLYLNNKRVTSVTIPDGVTEISAYLFSFDSLKSITIPDSVVL